jgi:hypothetical protein
MMMIITMSLDCFEFGGREPELSMGSINMVKTQKEGRVNEQMSKKERLFVCPFR